MLQSAPKHPTSGPAVHGHVVVRRGRVPERTVLLVASFGALLAFLDATIVNIAFPSIRESFPDDSIGDISWVLNAYNIVFAAFMIVFGRLCDLVGRRRVYLLGVALFTLSSLACALAPSVGVLVGARVSQALGAAMLVPASLAVVIDGFPAARRARAVGLWSAAAAVASGLGPPIGGALVEAGGWQWAFWVNLPLGAIAWWLGRRQLVNSRAPGKRRMPDLRGAILLAGSLGLINAAIIKASDWGVASLMLWLVVGGAVVLFGGFIASSMRHRSPVLDLAMMRNRPFLVANVATLVAGVGFFAYMLGNVLWLQYVWQYTILEAGLALVPGALVAAVVAGLLEPIAARVGYRWIIAGGFVVWALGYVWYVNEVGTTPDFMGQWLPGQVISGIGVGATLPLLAASTLATQPNGKYATASAVISSARQIGGTIGVALLVVVLGTPTAATVVQDLRNGWTMSIVAFAAGAVITLFLGRVGHGHAVAAGEDAEERPSPLRTPKADRSVVLRHAVPSPEESLFGRLPAAARERLRLEAPHRTVPAGEWLLRAGEEADSMFVVVSGRAEVVIGDQVVRELGPGAVVGELALFTDGRRSASIRARRDLQVLEVSRALLQRTIGSDAGALSALVTALAGQLAESSPPITQAASRPRLLAVVGVGSGSPTAPLAAMLLRGLSAHLRIAQLTGPHTAEQIDRAEADNEMVMLVADASEPAWAARCAREADAVVLVARADETPPADLAPVTVRPELVLVGAATRAGRQDWLDALDPWRFSEITMNDVGSPGKPADGIRGLSDRLAGRSVGLVLGGGGARALTHVGVLLELEQAGVRIDRIAGASMGSVIAGCYAEGWSAAEVGDVAYREFVREDMLGDYGLPRTSLARGRRVQRAVNRCYGDLRIEELPRGFRCVSTDLLTRAPVVHRRGSLGEAVKASGRLPVLFTPIPSEGRLLVDGGVLDNLPVDTLVERDEGPVIAVNISMGGGAPKRAPGEAPRPVRIPALGETMLRTLMIGGGGAPEAQSLGAWVITPHSMGVGLLEFHQFDRMVEAGRAAARDLLDQAGEELFA